jgi:hypothetical protein
VRRLTARGKPAQDPGAHARGAVLDAAAAVAEPGWPATNLTAVPYREHVPAKLW